MSRAYAALVTIVLCVLVLSPIRQNFLEKPQDDFPLSWYPMFARPRPALETPVYVVAVTADGTRKKVPQNYWTSSGFNVGATQLLQARTKGPSALDPLCERVAAKVRTASAYPDAQKVQILRGRYRREAWFRDGDHTPQSESKLAECLVPR